MRAGGHEEIQGSVSRSPAPPSADRRSNASAFFPCVLLVLLSCSAPLASPALLSSLAAALAAPGNRRPIRPQPPKFGRSFGELPRSFRTDRIRASSQTAARSNRWLWLARATAPAPLPLRVRRIPRPAAEAPTSNRTPPLRATYLPRRALARRALARRARLPSPVTWLPAGVA